MNFESWGRFPVAEHQNVVSPSTHREAARDLQLQPTPLLPRGLGRSYGDSCLNNSGTLVSTAHLDKFISFNASTGLVRCEAGVTLEDLILTFLPRGWFPPVTAGTKFVTIGGAIANDIHGKNHHRAGNFSHHVRAFELLRSDGTQLLCSRTENSDYFRATVGGLGLTGLILWAELQLKPVQGPCINMESIKFKNLDEFFTLTAESNEYEYTVSWLDCLATGRRFGRGVFMRGSHSEATAKNPDKFFHTGVAWKTVPFEMPDFVLSKPSIAVFNFFYYHKQLRKHARGVQHYDTFFYPLDSVSQWNKIYGSRGFLQWQCVVPAGERGEVMKEILA
ncbi:MAG: FAD-binding oxidoreductase, partial [Rhizobacter sp.]|nr:FAD-binding oxidoreductase [Chlorobiales bacterium]